MPVARVTYSWNESVKGSPGEHAFISLFDYKRTKGYPIQDIIKVARYSVELQAPQLILKLLDDFSENKLTLTNLVKKTEVAKEEFLQKKYVQRNIKSIEKSFHPEQPDIFSALSDKERKAIFKDYETIEAWGKKLENESDTWLKNKIQSIRKSCQNHAISKDDQLLLIAIIRETVRKHFGIYPYNLQILSLLTLLQPNGMKGRILQIKTGEGKSTIVTMLAAYLTCLGYTVDIVTSSSYLAARDQKKYQKFFSDFDAGTAKLNDSNISLMEREAPFNATVRYGVNSSYEFAYLFDNVYNKKIRYSDQGQKEPVPYHAVIVDEVDNLLIDRASDSARIAGSNPGQSSWVYPAMITFAKQQGRDTNPPVQTIRNFLFTYQQGFYKKQLEALTDKQLDIWYQSAREAMFYRLENRDYVVQWDPEQPGKKKIVIVDKNTGELIHGSRWSKGIHECVEAKHGIDPRTESLTVASVPHNVFFDKYELIYGVTGTLDKKDKTLSNEIRKIFKIDNVDIPTYLPGQRKDLPSLYQADQCAFFKSILSESRSMTDKGRPALILFQTIEENKAFGAYLDKEKVSYQNLNAIQQAQNDVVVARAGYPGMITLATNIAGRGTDITLHPESLAAGGLHVILAFYPETQRVEDQAKGRAGRQGKPGSSRIIISGEDPAVKKLSMEQGNYSFSQLAKDPQKLFDALQESRRLAGLTASIKRIRTAANNQELHTIMTEFFDKLHRWDQQITPEFLETVNKSLQKAQASGIAMKEKMDHDSAFQNSYQAFYDLYTEHANSTNFKSWLNELADAMKEDILHEWSKAFSDHPEPHFLIDYKKSLDDHFRPVLDQLDKQLSNPQSAFMKRIAMITGISTDKQ